MSALALFQSFHTPSFTNPGLGNRHDRCYFNIWSHLTTTDRKPHCQCSSLWIRRFWLEGGDQADLQEYDTRVQAQHELSWHHMIIINGWSQSSPLTIRSQGGVLGVPAWLPRLPVRRHHRHLLWHLHHGTHLRPGVGHFGNFCNARQGNKTVIVSESYCVFKKKGFLMHTIHLHKFTEVACLTWCNKDKLKGIWVRLYQMSDQKTPLPLRGYYFDERPSCKTTAKFFFIYVAARNLSFGHFCWAVLEKQLF